MTREKYLLEILFCPTDTARLVQIHGLRTRSIDNQLLHTLPRVIKLIHDAIIVNPLSTQVSIGDIVLIADDALPRVPVVVT